MNRITETSISDFSGHLANQGFALNTVDGYTSYVRAFTAWLDDAEMTTTSASGYIQNISSAYSPASLNSVISALNAYFVF